MTDFYFRLNTDGQLELRSPLMVPEKLGDVMDELILASPDMLGENEVQTHKSHIAIQQCTACAGTGAEGIWDRDGRVYTRWQQVPRLCSACGGAGNYI